MAINQCAAPPRAWVQTSSLAIYGDAGDRICDETAPHGQGFSVEVCERWEAAVEQQATPYTRKTILRIGFALGRGGGAFGKLARLARWGLGGTVGSGRQYFSWLHIADLNRMFRWGIEHEQIAGTYNATGPHPVPNATFMRDLRRALRVPLGLPAPAFVVRMGAFVMRTEASLALTGRRCVPARFNRARLRLYVHRPWRDVARLARVISGTAVSHTGMEPAPYSARLSGCVRLLDCPRSPTSAVRAPTLGP